MAEALDNLTDEVRHMRDELKDVREDIRRKPDMADVKQELKEYGFDDPKETKKDAEFVRKERLKHEKYDSIKTRVIQVVVTALIMGALTWTGSAIYEKIKDDVRQEQHP